MLATILIWLYTLFLCYVYGFLFLKLLQRFLRIEADFPIFPLIVVTGLVALTTLASFFSLFLQTGLFLNLLLFGGALIVVLTRRVPLPRFAGSAAVLPWAIISVALLIVLENATHRPLNPDTNIYHAQAIHWIESYPAVPGLGNLHGRLAFNSGWFVSNALFSLAFLGLRSFHLTASVLFLAVLLYFRDGFQAIARGEYSVSAFLKIFSFPLAFSLLGAEISSPGTDLPVILLLWVIAVLWAEHSERVQSFHPLLIVLLSTFVLSVKLSAAPILLLALFLCGSMLFRREKHQFTGMAVFAGFVLLPFLVRNMILSGYLLYPFPVIDLFSFDWKVPAERAVSERISILSWAHFPRMDPAQVLAMPFGQWFPQWLEDQTINRRIMLFTALLSPLMAAPGAIFKIASRHHWFGWLVFYLGVLFWLFTAPDFRFVYGFIIPTILLAFIPWLRLALSRLQFSLVPVSHILSVSVLAYLLFAWAASFEARTFADRLLLPADYDRVSTQACALKNSMAFCAKAYHACSYDSFPCIPGPRPWVELRSSTLRDGFRSTP
jgi:hypothetical protein